jgi:tRNA threonylcarbamoyladenosine biosynthesis protein TsaB
MTMDPLILAIDTSTPICSVSLARGERVVSTIDESEENSHASKLTIHIQQLFEGTAFSFKDLNAIAVAKGPGSYTGLRIGVSTAKGLCYALDIPLIAINSLEALATGYAQQHQLPEGTFLSPMFDARRMEVYRSIYAVSSEESTGPNRLKRIAETEAVIIDDSAFDNYKDKAENIILFGSGANKLGEVFSNDAKVEIHFDFHSSAKYLATAAHQAYLSGDFEDLAYFEPLYLKDFIPTTPKTK